MKPTYGLCLIPIRLWMLPLVLCCACAGAPEGALSPQEAPSQESVGVRGARYCEVLLAYNEGLSLRTQDSLLGLGQQLSLPQGWTYRTRQLSQELHVTAIDGVATIVQDELGNTYQLSRQ